MPRIVLVTCEAWPELSASDALFAGALVPHGYEVAAAPWNGLQAPFDSADHIILRATWDYPLHHEKFLDWVSGLGERGASLLNPPALVTWNSNKRYLLDLQEWGFAVPTTMLLEPNREAVAEAFAALPGDGVLKPSVGASGRNVTLLPKGETPDFDWLNETPAHVVLQELVPEVASDGELSLVFFDGEFSHAVRKRPQPGEFRINSQYGGENELVAATPRIIAQAADVLWRLPELPLYARVDGVDRDGVLLLLELELIEPGLFLHLAPGAAERFAAATAHRLQPFIPI